MPPSATESPAPGSSVLSARRQELLAAVSDPVRQSILTLLRRPHDVSEICRELGMAQPRISHHLAVLRRVGLVEVRPEGRRRVHRWAEPPGDADVRQIQELLRRWLGPVAAAAASGRASGAASSGFDDYLL